jgi:Ankyrin repeats (3 copies)/Ankyrin repeat
MATPSSTSLQLIEALKDGKTDVAQDLLLRDNEATNNIDVNAQDNGGSSALTYAAVLGDTEICKLLLQRGAHVNAADPTGLTALHAASDIGQTSLVQLLLDAGANIGSKTTTGATPLHQAAFAGRTNVVNLLLERGASVNDVESHGWSPLFWASRQGHANVVDVLLEHGANVTAQDNFRWTPLHYASGNAHVEAAYALLDHGGADLLTIQNQDGKSALDVAPDNPTETALRIHKALQGTRQRLQRLDYLQKRATQEVEAKRASQQQEQRLVDQQQQQDISVLVDKNTAMNRKLEQVMEQHKSDATAVMQENRNRIEALRLENQQQAANVLSSKAIVDETLLTIQDRLDEVALRCNLMEIVLIALVFWYLVTSHRSGSGSGSGSSSSSPNKVKKDREEEEQQQQQQTTPNRDAQQLRMRNTTPTSGKQSD